MLIRGLSGIYTGSGFVKKAGRKPSAADAGWVSGPIDILIDNKSRKIKKIGKNLSPNSEVFDGRGLVATAAFLDSHTHALYAGTRAREFFMRWEGLSYQKISASGGGIHNTVKSTEAATDAELADLLAHRLRAYSKNGTSVVEVKTGYGASAASELRFLRLLAKFKNSPLATGLPKILVTFLPLHALPKKEDEVAYVNDRIAMLEIIKKEKLADFCDAFPELGFFSLKESLRFARRAAALGFGLKIHADELTDMKASETFIKEKALSIDHLQKINPRAIAALAKSKTVATLLPATSFFLGLPYAPARKLLESGARVALATDFNPGTSPHLDFSLTQLLAATQFKMQAHEILCASTFNAAASLGLEKDHGHLSPGAQADILLWKTQSLGPNERLEEVFVESLKPSAVFLRGSLVKT